MSLNLVNYSDSSSDDGTNEGISKPVTKKKLPNPFEGRGDVVAEAEDESSEHGGRIRTFPHERGNWATYVYVHYPKTDVINHLQSDLLDVIKSTSSLDTVQFHPIDELHISLTRTVVLHHHWIDEFVRSIETHLKNTQKFWINLSSIEIFCNDNGTRTFLSISIAEMDSTVKKSLNYITKQLDNCLAEFKLAPFYKEASFHVSILWCVGDRRNDLKTLLPQFRDRLECATAADASKFAIHVDQLFCKIGNKLYKFPL